MGDSNIPSKGTRNKRSSHQNAKKLQQGWKKSTEYLLSRNAAFVGLLQKIAVASNEAGSIEVAIQLALDEICAHTGWPVGHAYLTDSNGELFPTTIWHLENPERFETFKKVTEATSFPPGVGLPGRVLEIGKPAWIMDVTKDPNFPRAKLAENIAVEAGFAFPVLIGTEVVAVLEFYSGETVEPDEQLLEVMTINIEKAGNVSIYMMEGQEIVLKAYRGYPDWYIEAVRRIPYPAGFTWKTITEDKLRYCPDVEQDTAIGAAGRKMGTKSYLSIPIRFDGKPMGAISINSLHKNAFDEEELRLLETVSQQIEIAINNAKQAEALKQSELLQHLAEGTASVTGTDFFQSLVRGLASALSMRYAFVTQCTDATLTRVRTLAFWMGKDYGENVEYALAGTPCEGVIAGDVCYYPKNIQSMFPKDKDLVDLNAESYLGIPIRDSWENILGHIAALDDKPLSDKPRGMTILQIFAARAAAEIERKRAEDALKESYDQLAKKNRYETIISTVT
ncbi:MAG: GAF domain-containing protein, partial [Thermodesulfobacteriota bacterium]